MSLVLGLIPSAVCGFLYVWYLRLAARWTLKISLSQKLAWIFVAIVFIWTILGRALLSEGSLIAGIAGIALHLGFGACFFGYFAVNKSLKRLGFTGGLKITVVAMGLALATTGTLLLIMVLLQKYAATS